MDFTVAFRNGSSNSLNYPIGWYYQAGTTSIVDRPLLEQESLERASIRDSLPVPVSNITNTVCIRREPLANSRLSLAYHEWLPLIAKQSAL